MNLVLYGAYNLSLDKCYVNNLDGAISTSETLQRLANAASAGSTIVNRKVNEKPINITGIIRGSDSMSLREVMDQFDEYINKEDRYLRVSTNWREILAPSDLSIFALTDDADNKSLVTSDYMYKTSAIGLDIVAAKSANNYASIDVATNSTTDLSAYAGEGCLEFWYYIPDVTYISGLTLKVGSDTSNYLTSPTITAQYDGSALVNGWNYLSVALLDMSATGVIDFYAFGKYVNIKLAYQSAQGNLTGLLFGGLIWQLDDDTRNYKGYFETIAKTNVSYQITYKEFTLGFICYSGIANSTDDIDILIQSGVTSFPITQTIDFKGTYDPEPTITLTLNSITNVAKIGVSNLTTGDTVEVSETWANGDIVIFNFATKQVTRNNAAINYTSVMPRFKLGKNIIYIYVTSTSEVNISYTTQNINLGGTI